MVSLKRAIYGLPIMRPYRRRRAVTAYGAPRAVAEGFSMIGFADIFGESWERPERALMASLLPGCDGLIDIGANHGFYSLLAAHLGKPAVAIEPEEGNLAVLRKNARGKPIEVRPLALSDKAGTAFLFGDGDMASLKREWQGVPSFFRQQVQVGTLDDVMAGREGRFLIKMDVEGVEVEALRGAVETLRGDHLWLIEVTDGTAFGNHSIDNRAAVAKLMDGYSRQLVGHNVLYRRG